MSSMRILMLKRYKMKKAASRNPQLWPNYERLRNQCTNAIRNATREHYHGLIEGNKDNPKRMWKTINQVLNKGVAATLISRLNIDGKIVTGEQEVAEALDQHFVSVGPTLAERIKAKPEDYPLLYIQQEQQTRFKFKTINPSHVLNALKNFKNWKSCWTK